MIQDFMTYDGLEWFILQVGRNPDRLFSEWLSETTDLMQGCADLGIDPPEEGPELLDRIKAAVSPALLQRCMVAKGSTDIWSGIVTDILVIDTETLDNIKTLWESLSLACQLQLLLVNQGWHELTREERPGLKTTEAVYQDVPVPATTQYGWTETKREVISPRQFVAWVRTPCKAYGQYVLLLGPAWLSKTLLWDSRRM